MATTQTATQNLLAPKPTVPPAPAQKARPYKDYLTPLLHRRFTHAALLILGFCYATSIILSPPSLLWIWNPFSTTTIRALLLFLPCLAVFIVRVANMHIGSLSASSHADWAWKVLGGWKGWHTLVWYLYSATFFGEVYLWSRAEGAGLEWVDRGREYERARVNENPLFLRAFWLCLAITQTYLHLARDEDRVVVPESEQDPIAAQNAVEERGRWEGVFANRSLVDLQGRFGVIAGRVARMALPGFCLTLPVYFVVLRGLSWPYYYAVTRAFFRTLPPHARPTGLQHMFTLFWQATTSAAMLVALWELSNAAFTIFVTRPPLAKNSADPLTGGPTSKDPNGSLLTGLKAKKEVPRAFAFWELSLICQFFDQRRKTIYTEVDRLNGSTWTQISQLCIDEISAIQTRIKDFKTSSSPPPPTPAPNPTPQPGQPQEQLGLPKIADRGVVANGALVNAPPKSFEHSVGNVAKSFGQAPGSASPFNGARARKAIEWTQDHGFNRKDLTNEANSFMSKVLRTPVGEPLRLTFGRVVRRVVLGREGRESVIVHASKTLSTLCAKSLREDDFGQVAKSIAMIIRTYVETITAVEGFITELEPHWTDVYFRQRDREVAEVKAVVRVLRVGLEVVVLEFGEYASSIGVSKKELREARELVAAGR